MKIKSIKIEIAGEEKELTMAEVKELHKILSDVLNLKENDALKQLLEEARKHKKEREPVYIPMPYPVYPQPAYPPYRSPFWYGTTTHTGGVVSTGNSADIKLLGCSVQQ